jgi:hypothetical protein
LLQVQLTAKVTQVVVAGFSKEMEKTWFVPCVISWAPCHPTLWSIVATNTLSAT